MERSVPEQNVHQGERAARRASPPASRQRPCVLRPHPRDNAVRAKEPTDTHHDDTLSEAIRSAGGGPHEVGGGVGWPPVDSPGGSHRSGRADFPHPAPQGMASLRAESVHDARPGERESLHQRAHAFPVETT